MLLVQVLLARVLLARALGDETVDDSSETGPLFGAGFFVFLMRLDGIFRLKRPLFRPVREVRADLQKMKLGGTS